eukprot:GHRR01002917.1.p1 GENE.GHRR01002917.1~~GHRR01002917.1.p1  ORF type:complete len:204 (+),score=68.94 GHRR01002917.1:336-947(+)
MSTITSLPATTTATPPSQADPAAECFDIYDDNGNFLGTEARSIVHTQGLLHKAVYCFVFDKQQRLLIQRRSSKKMIGPNQWDLSVAEHLSPGESFRAAAQRGMQEELGIIAELPEQPLGPTHRRSLTVPGLYLDHELVESYRLDSFDGQVQYNPAEVSAVHFISLTDLKQQMEAEPERFTEWFRDEIKLLNFFEGQEPAHLLN